MNISNINIKKLILIISVSLVGIGILVGAIIYVCQNAADRDQMVFESEIEAEMEAYTATYPIVTELPIIRHYYRIDYGFCEQSDGEFCLMISARPGYVGEAETILRSLDGFSDKYEIEYYDCEGFCDE